MTGILWTALAFAALGMATIVVAGVRADRKGGMDAQGILIAGTIALVVCEVVAIVLAVVGFIVG